MPIYYVKDNKSVVLDSCGRFIYEVMVFVQYENIVSMARHEYFSSNIEIPNIIDSYNVNKYVRIECYLYSAPKEWILDNDFMLYVKPEKKKIIKTKK